MAEIAKIGRESVEIVDGKIKAKKLKLRNKHPLLYPGRPKLDQTLVEMAQAGDEKAYKEVGAYFYEDCVFMGKFAQRVYFIDPYDVANDAFLFYPNILRNYKPKSSFRYYYIIWLWKSLLISLKKHMNYDIPFGGIESFDAAPDVKNRKIWGKPYRKDGFEMEKPMVIEADTDRFSYNPMTEEYLDKIKEDEQLKIKVQNVLQRMTPKKRQILQGFMDNPGVSCKKFAQQLGVHRIALSRGKTEFRRIWLELYGAPPNEVDTSNKKVDNA